MMLKRARSDGLLPRSMHVMPTSPTYERLLWLPDVVSFALYQSMSNVRQDYALHFGIASSPLPHKKERPLGAVAIKSGASPTVRCQSVEPLLSSMVAQVSSPPLANRAAKLLAKLTQEWVSQVYKVQFSWTCRYQLVSSGIEPYDRGMRQTSFADIHCSLARTLDVIGDWWSPLILRDIHLGRTRFDELAADLGISRGLLAARLDTMIAGGVIETGRVPGASAAARVRPDCGRP